MNVSREILIENLVKQISEEKKVVVFQGRVPNWLIDEFTAKGFLVIFK